MSSEITPDEIKRIRGIYGLTQQSFARVLGIGEASIVRYESGQVPTKANANLIRAAENRSFMLDCLQRDGDLIPAVQREKAEQIIYAEITFDEEGEVMDVNEIYEITLQQEILNEKAAQMLGDLARLRREAHERGDAVNEMVYEDITRQLIWAKGALLEKANDTLTGVAEIRGQIQCLEKMMVSRSARAA